MKHQPKLIIVMAMILFAVAASFFGQIMYLYDHSIFEIDAISRKLTYLNWAVIAMATLNGLLLLKTSRLVLWTTPPLIFLVLINNQNVSTVGSDYSSFQTLIASALFVLSHSILLNQNVAKALRNPRLQWWKVPERKSISLPITVTANGQKFMARTFDISKSGTFITNLRPTSSEVYGTVAQNFKNVKKIDMSFHLHNQKKIRCIGKVTRLTEQKGRYPEGIGIQFGKISYGNRKNLNTILEYHSAPELH